MNYLKAKDFIIKELVDNLDHQLTYHSIDHTRDVLQAAEMLANMENISKKDLMLLQTAVLFHDSGMLRTYAGHEDASILIAKEYLPAYDYEPAEIDIVERMIMATKLPQTAKTLLEKIICDADLDYLGRNDFFMIAHQLKYEWEVLDFKRTTLKEWYELQITFLEYHRYFTGSAQQLRNTKKADNLKQVQELVCFMK